MEFKDLIKELNNKLEEMGNAVHPSDRVLLSDLAATMDIIYKKHEAKITANYLNDKNNNFEYDHTLFEFDDLFDGAPSVFAKYKFEEPINIETAINTKDYKKYINLINEIQPKTKFQIIKYLLGYFWKYKFNKYSYKILTKWIPLIFKLKSDIRYVVDDHVGYFPKALKYCIRFEKYQGTHNGVYLDSYLQLRQRFPDSYRNVVTEKLFIDKINEEGKILFIREDTIM